MFGIGVLGAIFTVYNYFRNPQEDLEKKVSVNEKAVDGKAVLLAEQVKWEKEATEKRFEAMQVDIAASMTMAQNHIHTVETKVDTLTSLVVKMGNEVVRLTTIIEERNPKKHG